MKLLSVGLREDSKIGRGRVISVSNYFTVKGVNSPKFKIPVGQ